MKCSIGLAPRFYTNRDETVNKSLFDLHIAWHLPFINKRCAYNENERQDVQTKTQHEASYWRVVIRALMLVHQVTLVISRPVASIYYCLLMFFFTHTTYRSAISNWIWIITMAHCHLSSCWLASCMALNHRVNVCYFQMTKLLIISVAARTRVYLWLE